MQTNKDVVSRRVGGEVVLVHLETDQMYSLNKTGARSWELLSEGHDLDAIAARLADEFDVERTEARRELDALVEDLAREKLIERS